MQLIFLFSQFSVSLWRIKGGSIFLLPIVTNAHQVEEQFKTTGLTGIDRKAVVK